MPFRRYVIIAASDAAELYDLAAGGIVATSPTSTTLAHGLIISPDAFWRLEPR
ncbi:MAG: hypothetical protein ACRELV_01660 [Longimicrobiales bacterium]